MKNSILTMAILAPLLVAMSPVKGGIITTYVGTQNDASSWLITGAGATAAPAFQDGNAISITSTGNQSGTFVTGGSLANFNGFWMASNQFSLPANATSTSLTFSGLNFDDRGVLELNGKVIGNTGLGATGTTTTEMAFPPGPPDVSYTFTLRHIWDG